MGIAVRLSLGFPLVAVYVASPQPFLARPAFFVSLTLTSLARALQLDRERVFVSDTYNHRIVAYDRHTLAFLFAFGRRGARPGEFNCPCGE